jgi:hypothetical protein
MGSNKFISTGGHNFTNVDDQEAAKDYHQIITIEPDKMAGEPCARISRQTSKIEQAQVVRVWSTEKEKGRP